jgi:hypothetical protein
MTISHSENLIGGIAALAVLPFIGRRIWRGVRERRLPVYRTYLRREEGPAKFAVLLSLHAVSFVAMALISADLLLNLGLRERL